MKGLLLKDFYNTRRTGLILIIFSIFIAGIAFAGFILDDENPKDTLRFILYMPVIISSLFSVTLLLNSLAFDEQSNYLLYALTTPVNRNIYLKSKYCYLALTDAFYILTSGIIMLIIQLITKTFQISILTELLGIMTVNYIFSYAMGICLIAVAMKYSAVKASSYMSMFFGSMGIFSMFMRKLQISDSAKQMLLSGGLLGILAGIMIILIILSIILFRKSGKWLARKEF